MDHQSNIQLLLERIAVLDDKVAFEKVFHAFYQRLFRFAWSIVKDAQVAEEVVSDAFVNIWRSRTKLIEVESFSSFAYVVTRNIAIRKMTKADRLQPLDMYDLEKLSVESAPTPEDVLLQSELSRRYDEAVRALPPKCQLIYRMAKQDGLRYKEIAAILNISVKTIDAQLAIAVRAITKRLRSAIGE